MKPKAPAKPHQWHNMAPAERMQVFEKFAKVYHTHGYPEELLIPQMTNAYTMDFRTGNKDKNHRAEIAGFFTNKKIELA